MAILISSPLCYKGGGIDKGHLALTQATQDNKFNHYELCKFKRILIELLPGSLTTMILE